MVRSTLTLSNLSAGVVAHRAHTQHQTPEEGRNIPRCFWSHSCRIQRLSDQQKGLVPHL